MTLTRQTADDKERALRRIIELGVAGVLCPHRLGDYRLLLSRRSVTMPPSPIS